MIINTYQTYNKRCLPFKGVESDIQLGKEAIDDFKEEFPNIISTTKLDMTIHDLNTNPEYASYPKFIIDKLVELKAKFEKNLDIMRHLPIKYSSYEEFIIKHKALLKKFGVANCENQARLVQYDLLSKGKQADVIGFIIIDKTTGKIPEKRRPFNDHAFLVLNLDHNATSSNPDTWGTEAVIVDPWAGISMEAKKAIEFYRKKFKFNSEIEEMKFWKSETN